MVEDIYKELYDAADKIAKEYLPKNKYQHSLRVVKYAEEIAKRDKVSVPHCKIAAYLHDILEDSDYTELELALIFGVSMLEIIKLLSHDKKEDSYKEYIDKIFDSENAIAIVVKKADMKDHLAQKETLTPKLKEKYLSVIDRFL